MAKKYIARLVCITRTAGYDLLLHALIPNRKYNLPHACWCVRIGVSKSSHDLRWVRLMSRYGSLKFKALNTAAAVEFREFTPSDSRGDLIRRIDQAPVKHAEAVLGGVNLLNILGTALLKREKSEHSVSVIAR
jgi:hypothetical protein